MRKLLLTSSALVAAASISSYAVADVSVTGAFEWTYSSTSSNIAATDGDAQGVNNELTIKFTNKTDSGLTITGVYDIDADANAADESWMSIAGGFGTLTLGKESSVNDAFGIGEQDLIDEDLSVVQTGSASIVTNSGESGANKNNKLIYQTPAMGGFTAGYSIYDSGTADAATDQIAMGASYTMPMAGGSMMIRYNKQTTDGTATGETESSNYGVKITMGALSAIASTGKSTIGTGSSQSDDRNASGVGLKYDLGGGMTIAATTMKAEDDKDLSGTQNEEYSANLAEVVYTVAPGLKAKVTYLDYDYKAGGESAAQNDSGSKTQLTLSASF
ncbi:porin [Alphaproteobacteria bacterium]|nr:porin [Alphaproteobacteria bacterium]